MDKKQNILQEAQQVIADRRRNYGHPFIDYACTVNAFNALTGHKLTVAQGVLFMCCVKLSRESNQHKRDNLVDLAGYADCLQEICECTSGK